MRVACTHASRMPRMVQIRNVPDALHRKLKVRAADAGQTLSDYLLAELERVAARPTRDEMLSRLHTRRRVTLKTAASTVIREERESAHPLSVGDAEDVRYAATGDRSKLTSSHNRPRSRSVGSSPCELATATSAAGGCT